MKRWMRICLVALVALAVAPTAHASATAPPTTESSTSAPTATNDLLPEANNIDDCVGTVERANCGSRARADGHTYLVFLALAAGLAFIGWRIARGVRARDQAHTPSP